MKLFRNNISLSEKADYSLDDDANIIVADGNEYILSYLTEDFKSSKGGNSSVFLATNKKTKDTVVIKISSYAKPGRKTKPTIIRRYGRFIEEIKVLYELKEKGKDNVVEILFDGVITLENKEFPYYAMEKADTDLKEYIFSNKDLDSQEKVKFCINVYDAINQLHTEGYYHRDIKPDNILLFLEDKENPSGNAVWKIGDLGLLQHREKDYDDLGEKIGPFGWLSPEAGNKFLTEEAQLGFDCAIDDRSDVFQLGKLFWFIFQGNIPIGQLKEEDFVCKIDHSQYIFSVIECMLSYAKPRRIDMSGLGGLLHDLKLSFAV
ncbi:protein kinase [Mucilaginibacter roseus]|uniref:Protein kinase n=1 Tax=Mucilaginibacter roseus TaxID=1528868 RepID=A0ABS8TZ07_9SPHI|nr:protein kinase [Mucilaginibacter roseus]MCD8739053.1 protein kinase [Mucilaginibacter roseus]